MSNIRIKDIATTASASVSDDFIAIDGATNGTRKLSIYSPTIGGNLTVSGTGNSSVAGTLLVATTTNSSNGAVQLATHTTSAGGIGLGNIAFHRVDNDHSALSTLGGAVGLRFRRSSNDYGYVYFDTVTSYVGSMVNIPLNFITNNNTKATIATSGNFLIGTTTDSSNGKLQLATHTTSAGGIGFGTDVTISRNSTGGLNFGFPVSATTNITNLDSQIVLFNGSSQLQFRDSSCYIREIGGLTIGTGASFPRNINFKTNDTLALTIDTSQNATFAAIAIFKSYTVATLPAAAAGNTYGIVFVSDATNAAGTGIGTAPTGGGAVKRAVYSTGAAWLLL